MAEKFCTLSAGQSQAANLWTCSLCALLHANRSPRMKITSCKPIALTAPFTHPRSAPDDPDNGVRNCVWLCIETDEGVRGWGEVYAGCYATEVALAALRRLIRCLPGLNPLDTE